MFLFQTSAPQIDDMYVASWSHIHVSKRLQFVERNVESQDGVSLIVDLLPPAVLEAVGRSLAHQLPVFLA